MIGEEVLRCDIGKGDIYGSRFWECKEYWPGTVRYPQHICYDCVAKLLDGEGFGYYLEELKALEAK